MFKSLSSGVGEQYLKQNFTFYINYLEGRALRATISDT